MADEAEMKLNQYSGLPVKYKSLTISKNEMRVLSAVTKYGLRKQ